MHDGRSASGDAIVQMREKPETSISRDNPFLHLPLSSASRLLSRLFSSLLIRSRFAIYHRSINLCRDSPSSSPRSSPLPRPSLRRQCLPSVASPPPDTQSDVQSGAPLRAKSEDMIARECLLFYKIGYSRAEGDPGGEQTAETFTLELNDTPAATPI